MVTIVLHPRNAQIAHSQLIQDVLCFCFAIICIISSPRYYPEKRPSTGFARISLCIFSFLGYPLGFCCCINTCPFSYLFGLCAGWHLHTETHSANYGRRSEAHRAGLVGRFHHTCSESRYVLWV